MLEYGYIYEGEFRQGDRNGYGRLIYLLMNQIYTYTGFFKDNKFNGFGCLESNGPLNRIQRGVWKDSVFLEDW